MIARTWRGWATPANAEHYAAHFRDAVLPALAALRGFRGAHLLRRDRDGEVELRTIVFFDSLDDVRAFAGDDIERAVVAAEARAVLARFDDRVEHYDVIG